LVFNVRDGFVFRHVNKYKAFISVCKGVLSTVFLITGISHTYIYPKACCMGNSKADWGIYRRSHQEKNAHNLADNEIRDWREC
jgi:hypothetical protein